ncbi:hypothetical protein KsCSTR_06250 [Candidatus Kuenenia stuttgartiensis]|uniref:Uncharacterized protein n=1 Tax=Kuenenia stuttgartiensis TaxID=174633 RepID=A0A6G7GKX5_KUEST|nr:hypothetical protein KsCSTR_06250 [Candidatus Kuenenia stuttgartiensis]
MQFFDGDFQVQWHETILPLNSAGCGFVLQSIVTISVFY